MPKGNIVQQSTGKEQQKQLQKEAEAASNKKYCPFKKITDMQYQKVSDENPTIIQTSELEFFGECISNKCMAFKDGHCLLIEKPM